MVNRFAAGVPFGSSLSLDTEGRMDHAVGEQPVYTEDPSARRERILAKAREHLNRPPPPERDPVLVAACAEYERDMHRRMEEQRQAEERDAKRASRFSPPPAALPAPPEKSVLTVSVSKTGSVHHIERFTDVTMQRAKELCEAAWCAPFKSKSNSGFANKHGNCEGKALWLQKHLGGVVMTGFKHGEGRHAVLLLPIEGQLHVLDGGDVKPVADYPFFVEGFYERG